jgi:hypothetical protein
MREERPFLQIPLPSPEDWRMYEEWTRRQEEKTRDDDTNEERVVIIEV